MECLKKEKTVEDLKAEFRRLLAEAEQKLTQEEFQEFCKKVLSFMQ